MALAKHAPLLRLAAAIGHHSPMADTVRLSHDKLPQILHVYEVTYFKI